MDFKYKNTWLIEIPVFGVTGGSTQTRVQFQDQQYLHGTFTNSLETYTISDITKSPNGNDLIDAATLKKAYLTLYINDPSLNNGRGGENIQLLPLVDLHRLQNSNNDPFVRQPFLMNGQVISWDKCYITLTSPIANTTNVSFLINVGFDFNPSYQAN